MDKFCLTCYFEKGTAHCGCCRKAICIQCALKNHAENGWYHLWCASVLDVRRVDKFSTAMNHSGCKGVDYV